MVVELKVLVSIISAPACKYFSWIAEINSHNQTELLKKSLAERILILDGAMGTMIQKYKLTEADFRGERFKESAVDLRGNNDLLPLTPPPFISRYWFQ